RQPALHRLVAAVRAPALALSGDDGQIRPGGAEGLYVEDLRVLCELVVTLDGEEPVGVGFDLGGGRRNRFAAAAFNLAGGTDPGAVLVRRRELHADGMSERLEVVSRLAEPQACRLEIALASDLAPIAAVKSGERPPVLAAEVAGGCVVWRVPGGGSVEVSAVPAFEATAGDTSRAAWRLVLEPEHPSIVTVTARLRAGAASRAAVVAVDPAEPAGAAEGGPGGGLRVAGDDRLERFLDRSLADLAELCMATPDSPGDVFVAAGVPWFLTLFGRDSIWTARMLLPLGTGLALGTLRTLAARQGRAVDRLTSEEPGKILHELRREPARHDAFAGGLDGSSRLALPPVYYGTVDATPLWVCLLHDAWRWGLEPGEVERLLEPMQHCLEWIADFGIGGGGTRRFVSYVDTSGRGLTNQGWKDSHDAIQFRDGRIAKAPLALCEVQGYAYEAAIGGAELLEAFGRPGADRWRELAAGLAAGIRERFWVEDEAGPYPAVALDAEGAPVDSLTSNIGHLLGTGILDARECELVARRLGSGDLNSGYGLRTLAASSAGFNPLGYHTGSVWAHDTAIAIAGLVSSGAPAGRAAAASLVEGLLAAAEGFSYRMPELFGGDEREGTAAPLAYPASCRPQAWAAASAVGVLGALVGMRPDVPGGTLRIEPLRLARPLAVEGLRLLGEILTVRLGEPGGPHLSGVPRQVRLVG
ncbi:MAG TPA: glycogen debranching N-terminal domain-containing protein, partial [Acidimicrobiales bacterium]|nr:glycogen debranching N-terminal domain-containing protein [Acidimicrobiales bacterium]